MQHAVAFEGAAACRCIVKAIAANARPDGGSTGGMIDVFVINVDAATERWHRMADLGNEHGLSLTRIPAVTPNSSEMRGFRGLEPMSVNGKPLSEAHISCLMSHRKSWKCLLEGSDDVCIVLEDDICLAPSFAALVSSSDWFPDHIDVIKLETFLMTTAVDVRRAETHAGRSLLPLVSSHYGTAAYAISREGAAKALELTDKTVDHADEVLFNPTIGATAGLVIYQMVPAPCVQAMQVGLNEDNRSLDSSLGHGRDASKILSAERAGTLQYFVERTIRHPRKVFVDRLIHGVSVDQICFG